MATCHCRWRRVLLCVCTVFASLILLYVYIVIMVIMNMNKQTSSWTISGGNDHFIASGAFMNGGYAPFSEIFWQNNSHGYAYWNNLQVAVDHHFNPVLSPNYTRRGCGDNSTFNESVLRQSFSKVNGRESHDKMPELLQDFVSYMQRRDYPTLIEPDGLCGAGATDEKEVPLLLLAIKSTELNFKNRQAIRQTWGQVGWVSGQSSNGKEGGYIRRIFLLGRENYEGLDLNSFELLQLESKHYGDILQWDFQDTFFNLTLKDVLFWKWFSHYCSQTRFVFKGDDDIFVNMFKMIPYLQEQLKRPQGKKLIKNFMAGYVIDGAVPVRNSKSKYFIPESFYDGLYPSYASGGGVVYSGVLAKRLYKISQRVHLFPIDDAYVGMCMIRLKSFLTHHPAFLIFGFPGKEEKEQCSYHKVLVVHNRSPSQMIELWADINTESQCWDTPLRSDKTDQKPKV